LNLLFISLTSDWRLFKNFGFCTVVSIFRYLVA
jgi:hypothetical protein